MSSSRSSIECRPRALAALAILLLPLVVACGHKKPPVPPPRMIPATTGLLRVHQRGSEAVLRFPYPTTTLRGATLSGLARVEIYQYERPVPADALALFREQLAEYEVRLAAYEEAMAARQPPLGAEGEAEDGGEGDATEDREDGAGGTEAEAPETAPQELLEPAPVEPPAEEEAPMPEEPLAPPPAAEEEAPSEAPAGDEEAADEAQRQEEAAAADDAAATPDAAAAGAEGAAEETEGEEGEAEAGEEAEAGAEGEGEGEAAAGEEEPRHPGAPPSPESLVLVDPRTFDREAELVRTLEGAELDAAILGNEILLRLPLAEPPAADEETTGYAFAVRTVSLEGLESSLSTIKGLVLEAPPPPPAEVALTGEPHGIAVTWASAEDPPEGFKIYRREAQTRAYLDPVASPAATARTHLDGTAVLEARYIYAVTAVARNNPLLESAMATEHEVYYQDRFPPSPPTDVAAFPEPGSVRVLWEPSTAADVAGYIVYRRGEEGNAAALNEEPVADVEFIDTTAPAGTIQLYAVVAVDRFGNRSDASPEVRARVP